MRTVGIRESLGKSPVFSVLGWIILFVPSAVLVIVQESATPFPHFGYVVLSAALQQVVAGVVALPAVAVLRRTGHALPLWLSLLTWTSIGLSHGLVGGFLASAFAQVDPDFLFRVALWLLACWIWMPLFSYTAAQSHNRRKLLGRLDLAVADRDSALKLRARSADDIRNELTLAIRCAVESAIDDIRDSLAAARSNLDPGQLRSLGERLSTVSGQVGRAVERLARPAKRPSVTAPSAGAPLLSALTFERRRPWFAGMLASVSLGAVVAPLCVRVNGWPFLVEFAFAMLVATCVLAIETRIVPSALWSLRRQVAWVIARYGAAGLSAAAVLAAIRWNSLDTFTTVFILVLPYAVASSALVVSGAVGLADANRGALHSIAAIEAERAEVEAAAEAEENSIRDQLSQVMHGPVLGRLAACAMALNFHAAVVGDAPDDTTERLATAVTEHLDAAAADLHSLAR